MSHLGRRSFIMGAMAMTAIPTAMAGQPRLWIDRLETPGTSRLGTNWAAVTDGVMGGVSQMRMSVETLDGVRCYRMLGRVSTENRGGFIQMALPLTANRSDLDGSAYRGVRLRVRGNGEAYAVHMRTAKNWLPWDYFSAEFNATPEWRSVELPFDQFQRSRGTGALDQRRLQRIAIVGIGRNFEANVCMSELELYR